MTLFLEHSRLVNIAFVSFHRTYKENRHVKECLKYIAKFIDISSEKPKNYTKFFAPVQNYKIG